MKKKIMYSCVLILTLFVFTFVFTSCDISTNNNESNVQNTSDTTSNEDSDFDQYTNNQDKYYTITFKNDNGEVLTSNSYKEGSVPSYNAIPSKNNTAEYTYTFNGWSPSITAVTNDCEYVATYRATKNKYIVVWKNWDGKVLETDNFVEYGTIPEYNGNIPSKPSDQSNQYIFEKWDKTIIPVTGNIEYTAVYKMVSNYECLVQFDSKGGTSVSSQTLSKGDKVTKPANPTKEGYTFEDWYYQGEKWSFIGYTVTENMTLEAKWNINSYRLSIFNDDSNAGTISNSGSYNYNSSITIKATAKSGYTFDGWYNGDNRVSSQATYTLTMPARNLSYTARWIANLDTPYTVEHYLQNLDDNNYPDVPYETDNLTGITNTQTNVIGKSYAGFTPLSINQDIIKGDGTTKIKVYYERCKYTVVLDRNIVGGECFINNASTSFKYGTRLTIEAVSLPGYIFNGWYLNDKLVHSGKEYRFYMPAKNIVYTAKWTPNPNTPYTVEHYLQNIDDDNYPSKPYETDNLTGTTNTLTNAEVKTYEGFTSPEISQVNIKGDGKTVIKLYYARNAYHMTLNNNLNDAGEISNIGFKVENDLDYPWIVDENSITSTNKTHSTMSSFKFIFYGSGIFYFDEEISSELGHDKLRVCKNNQVLSDYTISGESSKTKQSISVDAGDYIIFNYLKDLYGSDLNDTAYIKNISFDCNTFTFKYGMEINIKVKTYKGYTFNGLYDGDNQVSNQENYTFTMPAKDLVYTVKWTANINAPYKVEHYLQNIDEDSYPEIPFETDNLIGVINSKTSGEVKNYEGFTSPEITQVNINRDGSTVIKLYYKRNSYTILLGKNNDKAGSISGDGIYKYDGEIAIKATTNVGYTFDGWYDGDNKVSDLQSYSFNMPAENLIYVAKWIANTNISYMVKHYLQNIDDNNYPNTPYEIDNLTGTAGTTAEVVVKTYEGFTSPSIEQVSINGNGSTVINLYYARNSYIVSLNKNNGEAGIITGAGTYKYGKKITIKAETIPGYTFDGWYDGDNKISKNLSYTFKMPAQNITYTAKWNANTNVSYKVEHYLQNMDDNDYPNTPYEIDYLTGTTDTFTNGSVKTYEGFTSPEITQVNINGDGSTVIKLYYARNSYVVSLVGEKGISSGSGTYKYGKEISISISPNPGYIFVGWYKENVIISENMNYSFTMPSCDLNYEFECIPYTETEYRVECYFQNIYDDEYTLNEYYSHTYKGTTDTLTDVKVYERSGFTTPIISQKNINGDGSTVIKLYYIRNSYSVTLQVKNGNVSGSGTYKYGEQVTIETTGKVGYVFRNWSGVPNEATYVGLEKCIFAMPNRNLTCTATWEAYYSTIYKVEYYWQDIDSDEYTLHETMTYAGKTDTMTNGQAYNYAGFVTPTITQTNIDGDGSTVIKLYYLRKKYIVIIDNQVEGTTVSDIVSDNSYYYEKSFMLTVSNIPSGYTINWIRSDEMSYIGDKYAFKVPSYDVTITITTIKPYVRDENKVYFGYYPQKEVTDSDIISELNTMAGDLPTSNNLYKWNDYYYYIEGERPGYMYYQDIDYDNNGTYDYRGVYFTQYRPCIFDLSSSEDESYQDDNGYFINNVYWFSFDPIEWYIMEETNGKILIVSTLILDSREFFPSRSKEKFVHNGGDGYANNYVLSEIRNFLIKKFYNQAFNDLQKSIIEKTEVDNSMNSTSYYNEDLIEYLCMDSYDYIFLLSVKEVSTANLPATGGTDYAKAQGLEGKDYYRRTPNQIPNWTIPYSVYNSSYGVRPACWIIL